MEVRRASSTKRPIQQSMGVSTWNYLMKEYYKEQNSREARDDQRRKLEHRRRVIRRSIRNFENSPFATNILVQREIEEHNQQIQSKIKKRRIRRKSQFATQFDDSLLAKYRDEIKQIKSSNSYLDERRLKAALSTEKKATISFQH